ncbi:MAG: hypothetical protein NTY19_00335 [Planctomycetota bacterium]|nr:hypothetical protein [Planctomycetota bacterium]
MLAPSKPRQRLSRRYQIYGLAISLFVHASVLVGLSIASVEPWFFLASTAWDTNAIKATFGTADEQAYLPPAQPFPVQILPIPVSGAEEVKTPAPELAVDPSQVTDDMLRARLDAAVAKAAGRNAQENLDRLDQMSGRLKNVASAGSISELAGTFQQFVGTKSRASQPVEHVAPDDFDYETAQFHDVKRYAIEPSGWRYVAVLLDAAGRTTEVEMDEPDGERVYVTLERIKANPLLEQVYRQIAMPLLDKMLGGLKQAAKPKDEGFRTKDEMP